MTMPQPLSHRALRSSNLSLLLGTLLRREETTRKQVEEESGLSKATVSRLVDDLLQVGALVTHSAVPAEPAARGRRAETLSVPSALGVSAGLSLGVRTTSVYVTDLTGRRLFWEQYPTRNWTDFDDAIDWSVGVVSRAVQDLGSTLRRLVVAVPARAIGGLVVTRPPLFMSAIEGPEFARTLAERLACPVRIELDAAMILAGLEALGFVERDSFPVLLNLGSVLTMSLRRRDGTIAGGHSASFGDFDLIPFETEFGSSPLGGLLSAHGLLQASQRLGHELEVMDELWQTDTPVVRRLRDAFFAALVQAIRIIVVMSDPSLIIFTGRLSPLVQGCIADVRAVLARQLVQPPALQVIDHAENDYPAAIGAAEEARTDAVATLLDRVVQEGLDTLR